MSRLALAIAVIPDVEIGRDIHHLGDLPDEGVYKAMIHLNNQREGTNYLPLYQYCIISVSVLLEKASGDIELITLTHSNERELLTELAILISDAAEVISWGGGDFERQVLVYRCLRHRIALPALFDEAGHATLKDTVVTSSVNKNLLLSEMATVLGFPKAYSVDYLDVLDCYEQEAFALIRQATDIDALNCFLVAKHIMLTKGELSSGEYQKDCDTLHTYLSESEKTYLGQYAAQWLPKNNQ